jgi:hypothetical protein
METMIADQRWEDLKKQIIEEYYLAKNQEETWKAKSDALYSVILLMKHSENNEIKRHNEELSRATQEMNKNKKESEDDNS